MIKVFIWCGIKILFNNKNKMEFKNYALNTVTKELKV